jgi:hypothetical protein
VFYHHIRCDRAQDPDRANLAYTGSDKIFAEIGGTNDYSSILIDIYTATLQPVLTTGKTLQQDGSDYMPNMQFSRITYIQGVHVSFKIAYMN